LSLRLTTAAQAVQDIHTALTWSTVKTAVPIAAAKSSVKNRLTAPWCRLLCQTCPTASLFCHTAVRYIRSPNPDPSQLTHPGALVSSAASGRAMPRISLASPGDRASIQVRLTAPGFAGCPAARTPLLAHQPMGVTRQEHAVLAALHLGSRRKNLPAAGARY
jgi:hypothetical protein